MRSPRNKIAAAFRRHGLTTSRALEARTSLRRSESGETLVEVLLALIILALASVALITAFGTDISASAEHRSLANFDTALASSIATTTSLIQGQYSGVFSTCPNPTGSLSEYPSSTALTSALNITGYTATIEASSTLAAVEYSAGSSFTSICTSGTGGDVGDPQLITLVVTDTVTGYSQTNSVVVTDPTPIQVSTGNSSGAAELEFVTEPEGATVGTPFTTQPILEVLDSNNHIVTTDLSPITLTLAGGTNGASLSSCSGVETSGVVVYSGCSINEVGTGYSLTASEPSPTTPGQQLVSSSTPFSVYSAQLSTPVITGVTPSTVTAGALNVTFTGSTNAPAGQTYTIKACTDSAMSVNCTTPTGITSGSDLTGLTPGTSYYVQITATATANFLASTSPPRGPTMATIQLTAPGAPTLGYGPVAGSLSVSFAGSVNAPAGETYTVTACTNTAMTSGCVRTSNVTSPGTVSGLTFVQGKLTSSYYVQVSASGTPGYLAYTPAPPATVSHAVTSQVPTPTGFSVAPSSSQDGVISASFTEPGGVGVTGPSSFTATACTDPGMSVGCVTVNNYTSGAPLGGLTPGTNYYVQVTAVASTTGYVSSLSAVSTPTVAAVQLAAPSGVTLGYGTAAGTLSVTFTPPAIVAPGQTYTLQYCTNSAMTAGCVTKTNFSSGSTLTALNYTAGSPGTTYFVQVTAVGSSGYLVSPASSQVSSPATSQVKTPTLGNVLPSTSQAGAVTATFSEPGGGTGPSSFTASACTNMGMTANCVTVVPYTSGAQIFGLSPGTGYFVTITALGPTGYASATTTAPSSSTMATLQIGAPGRPTLVSSTSTAGAISVTFAASSNAAAGQAYTAEACTDMGMSVGCVGPQPITSGGQITGLTQGTSYFVTVTAAASSGYLVSSPSAVSASTMATVQLNTPGTPSVQASGNTALKVTFTASTNAPLGQIYSVKACNNAQMTGTSCVSQNVASGGQITGLNYHGTYYVTVTASGSAGYLTSAATPVVGPTTS